MLGEPFFNSPFGVFKVFEGRGDNDSFFNIEGQVSKIRSFLKNWLHEPEQLKARKRTPYIIRAPPKGKERGRGGVQIHKLVLELGKEREEGISSYSEDHAC